MLSPDGTVFLCGSAGVYRLVVYEGSGPDAQWIVLDDCPVFSAQAL